VLGSAGAENLKNWVNDGGTLIGLGSALNYLISEDVGLLSSKLEYAFNPNATAAAGNGRSSRTKGTTLSADDFQKAITPDNQSPSRMAGFIVKAKMDPTHWMSAGMPDEVNVLVRRGDIYSPLKLNKGTNVSYLVGEEDVLQSGYMHSSPINHF
jgi:hypothetical protein